MEVYQIGFQLDIYIYFFPFIYLYSQYCLRTRGSRSVTNWTMVVLYTNAVCDLALIVLVVDKNLT